MSIGDKQPDSITASAQIVSLNNPAQIRLLEATHQNWQRLAWNYYDGLPDVHYPANFFAWTLSKFKLYGARRQVGVDPMDEPEATDEPWVRDAIDDLCGVGGGQSEILRKYGLNWMMAADMYFVGEQGPDKVEWEILSVAEVDIRNDRVYRIMAPGHEGVEVATDSLWRRIWKSHPKYSMLADGAMRSLAGPCEELELLNADIMARIRSRLAMAGILFMPNSLSIPGVVGAPNGDGTGPADPFLDSLQKAMLANITNPGTAGAVIPIMVRGPDTAGERIVHLTLDREIEEYTFNQRAELRMSIATGLDLPQEVQTDMKELNHWCVDDETEVLTDHGWVGHADLSEGDTVLTLNHDTGLSEWQPVTMIYRAQVSDEPMILMDGRGHSSLTTPNHRWPTLHERYQDGSIYRAREFTYTEDLNSHDFLITAAPAADLPSTPKFTDEFVELVAWLWTEGHVSDPGLSISQSHTRNPERVERIRGVLTRSFGCASKTLRGSQEPGWREVVQPNLSSFGGPVTVFYLNGLAAAELLVSAPEKIVTTEFVLALTSAQLELFTFVSELGDGWHHRAGRSDIWQRDPRALDAYELALIRSGRMVTRTESADGFCVTAWKQSTVRPHKAALERSYQGTEGGMRVEPSRYTGTIWCPSTPNRTWLARRRGTIYFTGNTSWTVMDSTLENHMVPPVRAFAEALTRIYLHPYGRALGIPEDELREFCVWEDHSDVVVRPNGASDARELRGLGLITGKATLNGAGLGEEDAIGDDEYVRWVGVKTANPYLSLYGLPVADNVDWAMVEATGKGKPPGSPGTLPGRTTVDNSNTTAGQPDPGIGKQAGGAITASLAADFVVAGPDYTDGVMVCVRPTPEQARRLTFPGGLPVDEMHCTLAYFGKVTDPVYQELGDKIKAELLAAICDAACETGPLTGEVTGVTVFSGNDTRPLVCLVDAPGLSALRSRLIGEIEGTADDVVAENHDFMPHITLGYEADDGSDLAAAESRVGEPLSFLALELVFGNERYSVPFTAGDDEMPMMEPMATETVDVAALVRSWHAERLAAAADVALDDVWKVAGAKMRGLLSQPSLEDVKAYVKGVPNERVVPILRDWALANGFDFASIVEFNGLTERVQAWEPEIADAFMAGLTGLVVRAFETGDRESITSGDLLDFAGALLQPLTDRQPEE